MFWIQSIFTPAGLNLVGACFPIPKGTCFSTLSTDFMFGKSYHFCYGVISAFEWGCTGDPPNFYF